MSRQRTRFLLAFLSILVSLTGCEEIAGPGGDLGDLLYFNSFESAEDTAGWHGYGSMQIRSEASPGGGHQSVRIAGACMHPHAYIDIAGPSEDSYLVLRCWGRNLAIGGGVGLRRTRDLTKWASIAVSDTNWTFYQSHYALFCPKGDSLHIEMSAGGIVFSAMLVDQLEIRKVR